MSTSDPPPAITAENVSKRFTYLALPKGGGTLKSALIRRLYGRRGLERLVRAIDDISFNLPAGTTMGVLGRNGSGKTTLLRLLSGIYAPDQGSVRIAGSVTPLLGLGIGFHPELSGRENARVELLMLGLSPRQIKQRLPYVLEFAEIGDFIDAPVRTYSTGMAMRLAFAAAVSVDPDVLLLDEVLSVGDELFSRKCLGCFEDFKSRGKTIILVTHNVDVIAERCDKALWLEQGRLIEFGDARDVVSAYRAQLA